MKALRFENNQLSVAEVAMPRAGEEAVVRVLLSGVCNTDLEIARGYANFQGTLGHEFVGMVEDAPEPTLTGRRVVGEINAGCGKCEWCVGSGDARHCPARTVLGIVGRDGAHAEFLRLPMVNLLPVPDDVPDEHAVFTEPLAAACGIIERARIDADTRVAVVGDGKLGLLCAQAVKSQTRAGVLLIGKHHAKLAIAARRDIETILLDQLSHSPKRRFDVVVEASGAASGFALALDLLRPRGTLVLKSTFSGPTALNAARIVVDEINVVGSRCGRFALALELLRQNTVDVESLISETLPLADGVAALRRAGESGVLKVLLRP